MERVVWIATVYPDKMGEYRKRHDEIWPEMTDLLNEAGISNYSIWALGNDLFGYYETEDAERAALVQKASPVVQRWNEAMAPLMTMVADARKATGPKLTCVFTHEGNKA